MQKVHYICHKPTKYIICIFELLAQILANNSEACNNMLSTHQNRRARQARIERDLAAALSNAFNLLASIRASCSSDI